MEGSAIPVEELTTNQIFFTPSDLADELDLDCEHIVGIGYDGERFVIKVLDS